MNYKKATNKQNSVSEDLIVSYDSEGNPYSYYSSDEWNLWSLNITISFTRLSGYFKEQTKEIAHKLIISSHSNITNGTLKNIIEGSVILEKCIRCCGGDSYSFINDDSNYREFLAEAKNKNLKLKTWKNYLIFMPHLYRENVINRDIGMAEELAKKLAINGDSGITTQALCLPEKIANTYYGEALRFVDEHYPNRHIISQAHKEYTAEYEKLSKKYKTAFTIRKYALISTLSLPENTSISVDYRGAWLSQLRGACYIVIAAFTGCRDGEIKSLNMDSYEEKHYAGMTIPTINGEHTKPNIGGAARKTSWVTIPAVRKAIELLWISFDFARKEWRERANEIAHEDERNIFLKNVNSLFITLPYMTSTHPNSGRQGIMHSISSFIKTINYKTTEDDVKEFNILNPSRYGELKTDEILLPHPHAFRRTFAVYLVKNKLASLLDIKYQFKHMNIAMTSWYANQANIASYLDMMLDTELQSEIAIENQNYMTDIFYHIYNEAETLAGPEGKRIANLRLEGNTQIYLNKEEIREQVKQGRLSIVEHPSGYCTNPSCDRICDMTTCQYKIVTKDKALALATVREKLIEKYTSLIYSNIDIPNVISKIYFEIRSIEKTLKEHKLKYKVFRKEDLAHE